MADERDAGPDADFTDAEIDMFCDFDAAVEAGRKPDIEACLARCPGSEARMRPILQMALLLDREVRQFRHRHPHVDLRKLGKLTRVSRKT
jgi:hypothetical protein